MDIGSIALILALAIGVGLFIARPFSEVKSAARKQNESVTPDDQAFSALLAERDRVVTALQELDFDYVLGKVPEDDYPSQRTLLLNQGAGILRQIDAKQGTRVAEKAQDHLEAVIAERRQATLAGGGNGNAKPPDDPVEAVIAARRRNRPEKAAGFCHKCGGPLQKSDRFCPKCGAGIH